MPWRAVEAAFRDAEFEFSVGIFNFSCVYLVKVIKGKDGRNRGFAFVTMSTAEEAAAAADKLNSHVSASTVALMRLVCTMV